MCLVTGATGGIGEATARALVARGATVLIVGRDPARCVAALARLRAAASGDGRVEALPADLSSQAQVRALAAAVRARSPQLDVLVHNAGDVFWGRQESVDGIEMTFALNHLAPFLLTRLLLEPLRAGGDTPGRVVVVSSATHAHARLDEEDWQSRKHYGAMQA